MISRLVTESQHRAKTLFYSPTKHPLNKHSRRTLATGWVGGSREGLTAHVWFLNGPTVWLRVGCAVS